MRIATNIRPAQTTDKDIKKKQEDEVWGKEKLEEKDDRKEKKGEEEKEKEEINKSTLKLF